MMTERSLPTSFPALDAMRKSIVLLFVTASLLGSHSCHKPSVQEEEKKTEEIGQAEDPRAEEAQTEEPREEAQAEKAHEEETQAAEPKEEETFEHPDYASELEQIIRSDMPSEEKREKLQDYHYNDIADVLVKLTAEERRSLYRLLGAEEV